MVPPDVLSPDVLSGHLNIFRVLTEDLINFAAIREHCNLWRNFYDVQDNWNNIQVGISHVITVGFAIHCTQWWSTVPSLRLLCIPILFIWVTSRGGRRHFFRAFALLRSRARSEKKSANVKHAFLLAYMPASELDNIMKVHAKRTHTQERLRKPNISAQGTSQMWKSFSPVA